MDMKKLAGDKAAEYVKDGMVVGLGTGSTAYHMVNAVGEMVKNGLKIQAIPTSKATEAQARELGSSTPSRAAAVRCTARRSLHPWRRKLSGSWTSPSW